MSNYDPNTSPLEYLSKASIGMTRHEFNTFVVGRHHSRARMIQDLLRRKQLALEYIDSKSNKALEQLGIQNDTVETLLVAENKQLIEMIDSELSKHDINLIHDIEDEEVAYWIDELARTSALEINTYGRIRPETMDKLMLMEEEHFISAMNKAGILVLKLKNSAESAYHIDAPLPNELPRS